MDKELERFMEEEQPWTSFAKYGLLELDPKTNGVRVRDQLGYEPNLKELNKLIQAMIVYRDSKS